MTLIDAVSRIRSCESTPPWLRRLPDAEIAEALLVEVGGMRLVDVLYEIGCEVVVEELIELCKTTK